MRTLNPNAHGILDYLTVVLFAIAPTLFGLTGLAAVVAYALAGAHLVLTLITDFPPGVLGVLPMKLHAAVELVVGLGLVVTPWFIGDELQTGEQGFLSIVGAVILVIWFVTDYRAVARAEERKDVLAR